MAIYVGGVNLLANLATLLLFLKTFTSRLRRGLLGCLGTLSQLCRSLRGGRGGSLANSGSGFRSY